MPITLPRARAAAGMAGDPLPKVFNQWANYGLQIRRGQFTLIAAAPGVGKSLIALTYAMRAQVPTYYFSADTDAFTMYVRAAAMMTGWTTSDVEQQIKVGHLEQIEAHFNNHQHIRFNFDAAPSMDDIDEEMKAFAAMYGDWPHLTIVDNLRNVFDPEAERGNVDGVCDFLHERARETNSAIMGLHHVVGQYDNGTNPVPLDGLMGKISKVPETVITCDRNPNVYENGRQIMNTRPVKQRGGKADPSGSTALPLSVELERMTLEG